MSFNQYSETPSSNYLAGYFLTGMAPSSVKVAGSDIMADLASRFAALHTATGSANAQVITQTRQWTALVAGLELMFLPVAANTGAATLAVDGLTAKNIFFNGAALVGGELSPTIPALVKYDGTQFNLFLAANTPYAASIQNNKYTYFADTGAVNALVITPSPAITAYADGQSFLVKVANTTTNSTPTINVNSLGTKNLYYPDGTTQILAGALILNNIYRMTYDSSLNSSAGGVIVENPSNSTSSFTATISAGLTTAPTFTVNYIIDNTGKRVSITMVGNNGTSNSTSMNITGVPSIITSATSACALISLINNGVNVVGGITVNSTTWTCQVVWGSNGGFTSTGTKGVGPLAGSALKTSWSLD